MDPEHSYTLLLLPHMKFNCPSSARSQPQAWRSSIGFQLIQVALACPALALLLLLELPVSLESVECPNHIMSTPNALDAPDSWTPSVAPQASQAQPDAAEARRGSRDKRGRMHKQASGREI